MSQVIAAKSIPQVIVLLFCKCVLFAVFVFALIPQTCSAQIDWTNSAGNSFYDINSNWSGGSRPGSNDTARFGLNSTYYVLWDSTTQSLAPDVGSLVVNDGDVTFLNTSSGNQMSFQINGPGGSGSNDAVLISGANTNFTIRGLHLNNLGGTQIVDGATMNINGSHTAGSLFTTSGLQLDANLNIVSGGRVNNAGSLIGWTSGETGVANISGTGSYWDQSGIMYVGIYGSGIVNIEDGGTVINSHGIVGYYGDGHGTVNVSGPGSRWHSSASTTVGQLAQGTLNIENGGLVTSLNGNIGSVYGHAAQVNVNGVDSAWNMSTHLNLGGTTSGDSSNSVLNIGNSGQVHIGNDRIASPGTGLMIGRDNGSATLSLNNGASIQNGGTGYIGYHLDHTGIATVNGAGSQWNNTGNLWIGYEGNGTLNIENGGVVNHANAYVGNSSLGVGSVTVDGAGSQWNSNNLYLAEYGNSDLQISNGGFVSSNSAVMAAQNQPSNVLVTGSGSLWSNAGHLNVGKREHGMLNIEAGGIVSTGSATMGSDSNGFASGETTINGIGSQWNIANDFNVGLSGYAILNIEAGGVVNSGTTRIAQNTGSSSITYVSGAGSQWNQGDLYIGMNGDANMLVSQGGEMNSQNVWLGNSVDTVAQVGVVNGSKWNINGDLNVGQYGFAGINSADSELTVQGRTTLHSDAMVHVYGRLDFGTTTLAEFSQINKYAGSSYAGNVEVFGINQLGSLTDFQSSNFDIGDVRIGNRGLIYGDGTVITGINNFADGEMEILSGERMRFLGNLNYNSGEINNFGGNLRMFGSMDNQAGGLIGGRGEFIFDGGLTNDGIFAMSGGFSDVLGDIDNSSTGIIAIGGGSVTTFYDDVTMNADNMNVDVAANSTAVFFGSYNGGATGQGTVHVFGDLRPGHSPAVVGFEGDLELAASTQTLIELAGLEFGEFDRIEVGGDFGLDGLLLVETIDGFELDYNQEFLFADIAGNRLGEFANFGEGDLVGNFNGMDLFVTYQAGDGNDIALFTAVPEPGYFGLFCMAVLLLMGRMNFRSSRPRLES